MEGEDGMIAFLNGAVAGKTLTDALIEVGGVGFQVGMASSSLSQLPPVGEPVLVHTYLQVREDAFALYGFLDLEEKSLFERLISVSGVGPKVALSALSQYSPQKLVNLIANQDVAAVQRVPGIGKKMASRIILELKGSLDDFSGDSFEEKADVASAAMSAAQEALLSMGFTAAEAEVALKGAPEGADESALLQYALKRLGS